MSKKNASLNFKVLFFAIAFAIAIFVATIFGCRILMRRSFKKIADTMLVQLSEKVKASFLSDVNKEIALSEKMVSSPVVRKYMEDPSDPEWHDIGLAELSSYEQSFVSKLSFWISDYDKQYFANQKYLYTLDIHDESSAWYISCLKETGNYTLYVNYDIGLKANFLWVDGIVRNDDGKPIAIAGTGIPLTQFINNLYKDFDSRITMYMYNEKMETVAAMDQKYLDDRTPIQQLLPNAHIPTEFVKETTIYSEDDGEYVLCPMPSVGWSIVMFCPKTERSFYNEAIPMLGVVVVIVSLFTIIAFSLLILSITRRIKIVRTDLRDRIQHIKAGDADLSKKIASDSTDELGDLVDGFNAFTETLRQIVGDIQVSQTNLSQAGATLDDVMKETSTAIKTIDSDIGNASQQIKIQNQSVAQTTNEIKEISSQISSLEQMISNQVQSVSSASNSVDEMVENIGNVNNSVEQMASTFDNLRQNTKTGAEKQAAVNENIKQIEADSKMLQEANKTISSIASQTNLLAMNAAIEAAHAGEAGKGFSVVAEEIRKLSETSSSQSKTIGSQLEKISTSISTVVASSNESQEAFNSVFQKITDTGDLVSGIKNAMGEQLESSRQIKDILKGISGGASELKDSSKKIEKSAASILGEAENLKNATENIHHSVETIYNGASDISSNVETLTNISANVGDSIKNMSDNIGKFKV